MPSMRSPVPLVAAIILATPVAVAQTPKEYALMARTSWAAFRYAG